MILKIGFPILLGWMFYRLQLAIIYPSFVPQGSRKEVWKPSDFELRGNEIEIKSLDGTKLSAYHILGTRKFIVIWFHGNAGNMGHRLPLVRELQKLIPAHFFMFDYRGYGKSEGLAHENGIKMDAEAVYLYCKDRYKDYKIIFAAQSLGGAAAIHVAAKYKEFDGLILENTFTSIPAVVPYVLPKLAFFKSFCVQSWASIDIIDQIPNSVPVLFMSSGQDEIIPSFHMKDLYEKLTKNKLGHPEEGVYDGTKWHANGRTISEKVWFHYFPKGTHNELPMQAKFFASWLDYFEKFFP